MTRHTEATTQGDPLQSGHFLKLHAYVGPGEAFSRTARSDEQGNVAFRGLATRDSIFYQATPTRPACNCGGAAASGR